ncbi:LAMI_0B07514g1_1 [Lachancea mirantina]|uniref:Mitochondrial distribution and morphology protein 12 n=1 Tax=Lachancea mirantina TaxID=1230905 RepID=A0A1G4IX88_9SACH|nr:LAMI_0B07514g1_1 [Lachancea mirantina]
MSFEINWENVGKDAGINFSIKSFINSHLESIELPSYVRSLQVTKFDFGSTPPNVILKEISDPLEDFYQAVAEDQDGEIPMPPLLDPSLENCETGGDKESDVQFLVEFDYKGNMVIEVCAELVLNYPSPSFMTLPVKLSISDIGIHSLCLIAYLAKQVFVSFLCDVSDPILDSKDSLMDASSANFLGKRSLERISLIRSIKISSEVGEHNNGEGSVLRSVGKLEQFLLEVVKNMLRNEAAWPSWINLDFNDEHDDDNDNDNDNEDARDEKPT